MRTIVIPVLAAVACLTASCADRLVFATHSSVGLDVSGTAQLPNKVSFSFERYEAAIVPRKTNGQAHAVFGGMDADMTWFHGHTIKQTFATGEAAKLAVGGSNDSLVATTVTDRAPLVFLTATTYGLNLSAGEQSMPPNLLLGYRRTEASVIPIPDSAQEVRSVYADILINSANNTNSGDITTNFSALGGVRIQQSFATGKAAETLAKTAAVSAKLYTAAGLDAEVQRLVDQMKSDVDAVIQFVDESGVVSADKLGKLTTDTNGKPIEGTETWPATYGGKPTETFRHDLVGRLNPYVDRLVKKTKELPH